MVRIRFLAAAAMAAHCAVSACTTGSVDGTKTTAIAPPPADISAADLNEGKQQFRAANYGLAEKHFRKAVELRADNAEAWMGLAASYDELGRFDFADRAYDQLLKLTGRKPQVLNNMGYSQISARQQEESQDSCCSKPSGHGRHDGRRRQSRAAEEGVAVGDRSTFPATSQLDDSPP